MMNGRRQAAFPDLGLQDSLFDIRYSKASQATSRLRSEVPPAHALSPPMSLRMVSVTVFSSASISLKGRGGWKT